MELAPKRVILFGGSRDGMQLDVAIDAKSVVVHAFEREYARVKAVADERWTALATQTLLYEDSGRMNAAGLPIFVLAA